MTEQALVITEHASDEEQEGRAQLVKLLHACPVPDEQLLANLGLFLESKALARILFMDFLFQQIVDVQGVVMDFGTRWGPNLALFAALRGIHDPFNRHRRVIGFDTFHGFPSVSREDGTASGMRAGNQAVTEG